MTEQSFLIQYKSLKRDMQSFPKNSPVRKRIKKEMSDLIQDMKERVEKGDMIKPNCFNQF